MEFKGTKGSWRTTPPKKTKYPADAIQIDTEREHIEGIADVYIDGRENDEGIYNAALITAAPDLLEALRSLMHRYIELVDSGDCGFWKAEDEAEYIQAQTAIAKALTPSTTKND